MGANCISWLIGVIIGLNEMDEALRGAEHDRQVS